MEDAFEEVAPGVVVYRHSWADGTCALVFGDSSATAIDGGGDPADGAAMAACLRARVPWPTLTFADELRVHLGHRLWRQRHGMPSRHDAAVAKIIEEERTRL